MERRARRVRVATRVVTTAAVVLGIGIPLVLAGDPDPNDERMRRVRDLSAQISLFWVPLACVAYLLRTLARDFARIASLPRRPPAAGPLATYREGPLAQCSRHPIVR